jgi:hypothetical protein
MAVGAPGFRPAPWAGVEGLKDDIFGQRTIGDMAPSGDAPALSGGLNNAIARQSPAARPTLALNAQGHIRRTARVH